MQLQSLEIPEWSPININPRVTNLFQFPTLMNSQEVDSSQEEFPVSRFSEIITKIVW